MAIRGNVRIPLVEPIAAVDIPVLAPLPTTRAVITQMSVYNGTGVALPTIEFYRSPDLTSASGVKVMEMRLAKDVSQIAEQLLGLGLIEGDNLIALAPAQTGYNIQTTVTLYDDGD